jgi:hypothetical protein
MDCFASLAMTEEVGVSVTSPANLDVAASAL